MFEQFLLLNNFQIWTFLYLNIFLFEHFLCLNIFSILYNFGKLLRFKFCSDLFLFRFIFVQIYFYSDLNLFKYEFYSNSKFVQNLKLLKSKKAEKKKQIKKKLLLAGPIRTLPRAELR
jgi:hypothetical protein